MAANVSNQPVTPFTKATFGAQWIGKPMNVIRQLTILVNRTRTDGRLG